MSRLGSFIPSPDRGYQVNEDLLSKMRSRSEEDSESGLFENIEEAVDCLYDIHVEIAKTSVGVLKSIRDDLKEISKEFK